MAQGISYPKQIIWLILKLNRVRNIIDNQICILIFPFNQNDLPFHFALNR
jgi:hypothetical protein